MPLKVLFITACFAINLFYVAEAQIKKGSLFLGGNISFLSFNNKYDVPQYDLKKQRSVFIQPTVGKAINENMIMGVSLGYDHSNTENRGNADASKRNQYSAGLFLRKYKPLGAGFSLFGQTDLYFAYGEQIYDRMNETETIKGPSAGLIFYPGLSYSISKKLQLETGFNDLLDISYGHENTLKKNKDDNKITAKNSLDSFIVRTSLDNLVNFTLGFRLLISK